MTSLIRAFFFDPLERLTWHLCLCNVTNSKKKKKKIKGVAFGLCHEGCNILFRFCLPCVCQDAALVWYRRRQCRGCRVAGFVRYTHWISRRIQPDFPDGERELFFIFLISVFVSLPFLHTSTPETSVADKHDDCTPVSSAPEGSRGCLLAHAQHAERGANDTIGQMVILHCVRLGEGGLF